VLGVPGGEWCVEVRDGPGQSPVEHWTADVEAFLATLTGPAEVRFTHGQSRYLARFRDLQSEAASEVSGTRYTEFGWRPLPAVPPRS
jgi:hypothetical protein